MTILITTDPTSMKRVAKFQFQIARPAPKLSTPFYPQLLFQIQELPAGERPAPVLEVWRQVPFWTFVMSLFRSYSGGIENLHVHLWEPYVQSAIFQKLGNSNQPSIVVVDMPLEQQKKKVRLSFNDDGHCDWSAEESLEEHPCWKFTPTRATDAEQHRRIVFQWTRLYHTRQREVGYTLNVMFPTLERKRIATMSQGILQMEANVSDVEMIQACIGPRQLVSDNELWVFARIAVITGWIASQEGWQSMLQG